MRMQKVMVIGRYSSMTKLKAATSTISEGKTKMKMDTFEIRTYEVWGNPKDGFEVNNSFRLSETITLPSDGGFTDHELIKALKAAGVIKAGCHFDSFEVDGEWDRTIFINQTNKAVGGLYPFCEVYNLTQQEARHAEAETR